MAVIDGLGQGPNAQHAASIVKDLIQMTSTSDLAVIIRKCDRALRQQVVDGGAAMGLLLIKPKTLHYAAVGDTTIRFFPQDQFRARNQPGVVGLFKLPVVRVIKQPYRTDELTIVMTTDGIVSHWNLSHAMLRNNVQSLAHFIMQKHRRPHGDATVLAVRVRNL